MAKCLLVALMTAFILAGCGGGGGSTPATLVSITVLPANKSIAPGTTLQFSATGIFSDNTAQDLTASVAWSSSNNAIATISNAQGSKGIAMAVAAGTATITATSGNIPGSTTFTPSALASIAITPANPTSIVTTSQRLKATGKLTNGDTQDLTALATWNSSNPSIATVSDAQGSKGLATAVAAGTATISATFTGVSDSTPLTATTVTSIAVTPANSTIAAGMTQQFTATGTLSNGTTQDVTSLVAWSSSNTGIATISAQGIASAVSVGSTTISAAFGGVTDTTTLTVQGPQSITVTPVNPSAATGSTLQFTAKGNFQDGSVRDLTTLVTWSSSKTGIATISNATGSQGLATAIATGSTVITATMGTVSGNTTLTVKTLASIAVSPVNPIVGIGATLQFTATGTFSDGTSQDITSSVTWSSANSTIATISNASGSKGVATGNGFGTTTIKAAAGSISGSTQMTVTQTGRVYVTNGGSSNLSVINTTGNTLVATIPVGLTPQGVATNSAGQVYVANSGSNTVSVVDTTGNTVVKTIGVGLSPQGVAVNPAAGRLYVANSGSNTLTVIDTSSNTMVTNINVGSVPRGVAVNPATSRAYVANSGSNTLSVIDTIGNTVVATIPVGNGPRSVAVNPTSNNVYVTNNGGNTLSVIDTSSNTVVATVNVGTGPQGVAVNSSANRVYVANSGSGTLSVVDASGNTVVATVNVGVGPQGVAVNPSANRVYVANGGSNTISVIDTSSNTVVATVNVGTGPKEVAVIP